MLRLRPKDSLHEFLLRVMKEFPGVLRSDNWGLFCSYCEQKIAARIWNVKQILASENHKQAEKRRDTSSERTHMLITPLNESQ